ncbi:MAG: hypothetical protein QG591_2171, partial [Planctomycetota bacterium]|nr:hypothetical protein [Planctomycetota bacterium]
MVIDDRLSRVYLDCIGIFILFMRFLEWHEQTLLV